MRNVGLVAVCVVALCAMLVVGAYAAEEGGEKPKKARGFGEVKVTKNENGEITAVTLVSPKGTETACAIDEGKGAELGKTMEGKKVMAAGSWKTVDEKKVLVVEEFKEATARPPKKPKKEE